jgi:hypothetical protein
VNNSRPNTGRQFVRVCEDDQIIKRRTVINGGLFSGLAAVPVLYLHLRFLAVLAGLTFQNIQ